MKTLFFVVAAGILSLNAVDDLSIKYSGSYCAEVRDGLIGIVQEGKTVSSDIVLDNGTTIKTNGTVVMKDGSKFILSDGDCVDLEGNLIIDDANEKTQEP